MNLFEKIIDILQFRETPSGEETNEPVITTGSVIFGALLRSAIVVLLVFFVVDYFDLRGFWWITAFLVWGFAAYPAYRQYLKFNETMQKFEETTLCGKCKHFDPTSQLCRIYDEHVTEDYIPCEGESWEPKSFEVDDK